MLRSDLFALLAVRQPALHRFILKIRNYIFYVQVS